MLKKKKQHKYLAKRWHAIRSYLNDFADTSNLEVLHKLRVEVKKLKAFAAFAESSERDAKEAVRPLRKMFRKAGEIREAGLALQLMHQYHIAAPQLKAATEHTLEQQKNMFHAQTAYYGRQAEKAGTLLRKGLHKVRNKQVRRWMDGQLTITAGLLAAPPPGELHNVRKKIKNILNVYAMLPAPIAENLYLNEKYLQRLQEKIGNWHDVAVAAALLPPQKKGKGARGTLLQKEQEKLQKSIQRTTRNFLQRVKTPAPPEGPSVT